jgi:hypothetical protein
MIKEITSYNFDEILFEYFEGTLNDAEKKNFLDFIEKNPSYQKDFELWGQSMVASDNIEVPEGLEDLFTKKESFWKSSKGKISLFTIAAAMISAVVIVASSADDKIDAKEVQEQKTNLLSPEAELNTNTTPSQLPVIEDNTRSNQFSQPQKRESIKSERQTTETIVLPNIFTENDVQSKSEPIIIEQKLDTLPNNGVSKAVVDVNTKTVIEQEKVKSTVQPTNKNPKFDVELNNDKLGKPKNIIDMQQKLDEN